MAGTFFEDPRLDLFERSCARFLGLAISGRDLKNCRPLGSDSRHWAAKLAGWWCLLDAGLAIGRRGFMLRSVASDSCGTRESFSRAGPQQGLRDLPLKAGSRL